MSFTQFPVHPKLHEAVRAMGFTEPTPIQSQAIPPAMEGRDVLGSAQTGSGKTVAFGLPLLHKLLSAREAPAGAQGHQGQPRSAVRAMVLVPTRELAAQVETCVHDLTRF